MNKLDMNYKNNLDVLDIKQKYLSLMLKELETNENFEVFQGKNLEDINILDHKNSALIYPSPKDDLKQEQKKLEPYEFYEVLFFYGIGNGFLLKQTLKNSRHFKVIVIEPNLELIYIALHLHDFSDEIKDGRFILLLDEQISFANVVYLMESRDIRLNARNFQLHLTAEYYNTYYEKNILECSSMISRVYEHAIIASGNDVIDSLMGIEHHIVNLPEMIKSPSYQQLVSNKITDTAVIVSTGPSLHKQLPLLKEIQDYITIISVDASIPILEKYGIQADLCASIERIPETAKFFENTSESYQKKVIFASSSVQHEQTLGAIKGTKVIIMRPFGYNKYFQLDNYGYLGSGMSAANLAHELAYSMQYTKVVLIGQDLAYGKNGDSHSQGHIFTVNESNPEIEGDSDVEAYGGEGTIRSTRYWNLFRNYFEHIIEMNDSYVTTYNATEGGARIKGSIEITFKDFIKEHVDTSKPKESILLTFTDDSTTDALIESSKKRLDKLINTGKELQQMVETTFTEIASHTKRLENKSEEEMLNILSAAEITYLLDEIEFTRNKLQNNEEFMKIYYEMCQSFIIHQELDLAVIKAIRVKTQDERTIKALKWIVAHSVWFFYLGGGIDKTINVIERAYIKAFSS